MKKKFVLIIGFFLLTMLFSMSFLTIVVSGLSTIYVDDDNTTGPWDGTQSNPYRFIQDAINASDNGDIIQVKSGTYYQNININKSISLVGENRDTTILHSSSSGPLQGQVISIAENNDGVNIHGFTIKSTLGGWKSVIHVWSDDNDIYDNIIDEGYIGISLSSSNNNNLYDNQLKNLGQCGLYIEGSSNNDIFENEFVDIITGSLFACIVLVDNCDENSFYDNDFTGIMGGYAIKFQSGPDNNVIYHNNFQSSGIGGYCCDDSSNNFWYSTTLNEGNYWQVYNGLDADNNGIGDSPFSINCTAGKQDIYPFLSPDGWINQAPLAVAGGPYYINEGENLYFNGSTSNDPDGSIISYEWDFGDGSNGNGITTTHSYENGGEYEVILTVTDDDGASDSDATTVYVNHRPNADAGGPYYSITGDQIILSGGDSSDQDGSISLYEWDLDNDGIYELTGSSLSCTWDEPGVYNIKLKVTDNNGFTNYDATQVIVSGSDTNFLSITSEDEVYEENIIEIIVTSEGAPVVGVNVKVKGTSISVYTTQEGIVELTAPTVNSDTEFILNASKSGFLSCEKTILVKNQQEIESINLIYPNGGESLTGIEDILWETSNIDESSYAINVQYLDTENIWSTIINYLDVTEDSYTWDTTELINGENYKLKIELFEDKDSDGIYETKLSEDISDNPFTIENNVFVNGWLSGHVTEDESGVIVPLKNAKVCVILSDFNNVQTSKCTFTDENGKFNLSLSIGFYTVTATKKGYNTAEENNVEIIGNEEIIIDFELQRISFTGKNTLVDYTVDNEIEMGNIGLGIDIKTDETDVRLYDDSISADIVSVDDSDTLISFIISAPSDTEGTKIILYLGKINPDAIKVEYDGMIIKETESVSDFFNKENQETNYLLLSSGDDLVLIINNPTFSTHSITVFSTEIVEEITENSEIIILIGSLILIIAVIVTFRKSKV